jgi:hypothetical protein
MKPPRERPTDDKLREISGHVSYEFDMLALVASELIDSGLSQNPVIQFALIESFLIHARQVHQFLARDASNQPHDVFAVDYCPEWSQKRTAPSALLQKLLKDVSVRAAHLTLHRAEQHAYPVSETGAELLSEVRRFLELAPPDLFAVRPTADLYPGWAKQPAAGGFEVRTTVSIGTEVGKFVAGRRSKPR